MGVLISVLGGTNKRDGGIHKHDEGASKRNEVRDRRRYMYQMKAKRKGPWHANKEGTEPGPGPWSTWAGTRFMQSCSNMYPQNTIYIVYYISYIIYYMLDTICYISYIIYHILYIIYYMLCIT